MVRRHAAEHVHERSVEEGVAFAQHRDVSAGVEVPAELGRGPIVDLLRRESGRHHGHPDADFFMVSVEMGGHDAAHEARALLRGRIREHAGAFENAQRLQRDQLRIARTDAEPVQGAFHRPRSAARLVAASWVTGISGRQPR